jgi:hypothetical protein
VMGLKALGRFAHAQPDILADARIGPAEAHAGRPRPFSPPGAWLISGSMLDALTRLWKRVIASRT